MNTATENLISSLNAEIDAAKSKIAAFGTGLANEPDMAWHKLEWAGDTFRNAGLIRAYSTAISVITNQSVEAALVFCTEQALFAAQNPYRGSSPANGLIADEIASSYARLVARLQAHINFNAAKAA